MSRLTRVYCLYFKAAGMPAPEIPVPIAANIRVYDHFKHQGLEINNIIRDLNAVVDSKDHSEVLRLIESAKEKLKNLNIDSQIIGVIKAMGTPHLTAETVFNPTHKTLGEKVFPLLNDGFNVFIERTEPPFSITIRPFTTAKKVQHG